ncbi:MAG: tetratricopeptide repeat protein [Candidatus Eremiobacterota bacterium]
MDTPDEIEIIFNYLLKKGNELEKFGKYKDAIKCYDIALEIDFDNDKCWRNKHRALDNLEKHEEAKRLSESKITNRGSLSDVYKNLPRSNYKDDT